jgi:hypothetical protein
MQDSKIELGYLEVFLNAPNYPHFDPEQNALKLLVMHKA